MTQRAGSAVAAYPLFQTGGDGAIPIPALSAKDLWFSEIKLDRARELNANWHRTLPQIGGGGYRVCFVAEHDGLFYATAVWSNPSSPKLPQTTWIQLKRFAISDDSPKNTASRFGGWMEGEIRKRYPDVTTLVSYQDCDKHTGTIYAAMGWTPGPIEVRSPKTTWRNRKRGRQVAGKPKRVRRWTKHIR